MYFDYAEVTSTNTAQGLPAAKLDHPSYGKARMVQIDVETNPIRYTLGGTDPATDGTGVELATGAQKLLSHPDMLAAFRLCSKTADTAGVTKMIFSYL